MDRDLDVIAVTDHNSAENTTATVRAAEGMGGPRVLSGLEICTVEEIHLLALFDSPAAAGEMQHRVYAGLPERTNRPELFGDQIVANEFDEVDGFVDLLLIGACSLSLTETVNLIHGLGGLAVAAHVDRPSYSIISQLGFVPADLALDALELSTRTPPGDWLTDRPDLSGYPHITGSDAHRLADIGRATNVFYLERPTLSEISWAFTGRNGRSLASAV